MGVSPKDLQKYISNAGLVSLADIKKWPDPKFIVDGLLPERGFSMLYGPSGVGKSFVVLDIMKKIATGIDWFGSRTKKGFAIYVSGEGRAGLKKRTRAWIVHSGKTAAYIPFAVYDGALNLSQKEDVERFVRTLEALAYDTGIPLRLVVFDTLARCTVGKSDSDSKDMGEVVDNCAYIQSELDTAVMLVHHTGHDHQERARGSSAIRAAVDTEISVSKSKSDSGVKVQVTKQKDSSAIEPMYLLREPVPDTGSCVMVADNDNGKPENAGLGKSQVYFLSIVNKAGSQGITKDEAWGLYEAVCKAHKKKAYKNVPGRDLGGLEKKKLIKFDGKRYYPIQSDQQEDLSQAA